MTKSIIIAGSSLGVGHLQAAQNLTKAMLHEQPSWMVRNVDVLELLPRSLSIPIERSWRLASQNGFSFYSSFYKGSIRHPLSHFVMAQLARFAVNRILATLDAPPDVFVATHSFAVPVGSRLKELLGCKLCVVTTDFIVHELHVPPNVDFVCVPPVYECSANLDRLKDRGSIVDTGIPIAREFAAYKDSDRLKRLIGLAPNLATVLFSFGGSGLRADEHVELFSKLLEAGLPLQFIVLAGRNSSFSNAVRLRYGNGVFKNRIKVFDFVNNVSDFYAVADFFIGKAGGLSTSEALAAGLPILLIDRLPGQEEFNLRVLQSNGAASYMRDIAQLQQEMRSLLARIRETGKRLHEFARPLSSETVAHTVASLTA